MGKKIIWSILILLMVFLSGLSAFALVPIGFTYKDRITIEEPFYSSHTREQIMNQHDTGMDTLSDKDKMKTFSRGTKIDGATCSLFPDKSMNINYGTFGGEICFNNENHIGKVISIFDVTSGYWVGLGSLELTQKDKQCIDIVPDKNYIVEIYYCDIIEDTSCIDTDSDTLGLPGDYEKYGEVTVIGDVQGSTTLGDTCSGNWLQERFCDSAKTMLTKSIDCNAYKEGYVCYQGKCQLEGTTDSITGATIAEDTTKAKSGVAMFQGIIDFFEDLFDAIFG